MSRLTEIAVALTTVALTTALTTAPALAQEATLDRSTVGSATVWHAQVPGRVTSLETWGPGRLALRVLPTAIEDATADQDTPVLWRLDTTGKPGLVEIGPLPNASEGLLAPPVDQAATPLLVTAEPGQLWSIAENGTTETLRRGPHATLDGLVLGGGGRWALAEVGRLRLFAPGQPAPIAEHRLPVTVERRQHGLVMSSPRVATLWPSGAAAPIYLAAPQAEGKRRLRTVWVDGDSGQRHEAWSSFPTAERLAESSFALVDGQPMLFAVTLDGDKVSLFGKKRLFVFALTGDRTRAGRPATFETVTASRLWQPADYHVGDVDADGLDDLVLLQPEGFAGKKLIVEAYRGRGGGRFETKPRRSVVGRSGTWIYGHDLTGDGEPDLAVLDGDLEVFPGVVRQQKKAVIDKAANWRLPVAVEPAEGEDAEPDAPTEVTLGTSGADIDLRTGEPALRAMRLWGDSRPATLVVIRQAETHTELWLASLATGG